MTQPTEERLVYASPDLLLDPPEDGDDLAAVSYSHIPYIERRWLQPDYIPVGSVTVYVAAGGTGKGMLFCAHAARVVLGLPFANEDQAIRRDPGRVVWISGPGEDDQFEDLAPRFRAAIAVAVAEFGLDPELAGEAGAVRYIHDLSVWRDDSPVTLPKDCPAILTEIKKLNAIGGPPVALVVADSLSAVLSDGYTIDSRQGATRTMVALGRFARRANVALAVLHHLTKDGKVAGSAGLLNSVRLAFVIQLAKDDERVRLITRHKSNISDAEPLRYIITGSGPATHAEFVAASDQRAERLQAATGDPGSEPDPGSLRARMAAASGACRHPSRRGTPAQCSDCPAALPPATPAGAPDTAESQIAVIAAMPAITRDPGPFRVSRRVQPYGTREMHAPQDLGTRYATRADARAAVLHDAGQVLTWREASTPGMEVAGFERADRTRVAYLVAPVRNPDGSVSAST
jgi:hypothetical protein